MSIRAIAHVSRLRGGSQAQVMLANDGHKYAVKFQGNPQSTRVLANDYLAARMAQMIGLSAPEPVVIYVDVDVIRRHEIMFRLAGQEVPAFPGLQFGSRMIADEQVLDWLPQSMWDRVRNLDQFAGALAFDKWTCNADSRQVVFHKNRRQRKHTATFIDFGYCFNAAEWSFPDSPLRGTYPFNEVYEQIESWVDFEPWISHIEDCSASALQAIADEIPKEWYGSREELDRLLESLLKRRRRVRELIDEFRKSSRNPFPQWGGTDSAPAAAIETRVAAQA